MVRRWFLSCAAAALVLAVFAEGAAAERPVTVLAAASLTEALTAIGERWRAAGGHTVRFAFTSSSRAARQIEAGAPADIFASANVRWMDYLAEKGLIDTATRIAPIANGLVLVAPAGSATDRVDLASGADLLARLGTGERLAVGDPAHVPAGIYARQALTHLGIWRQVEARLAPADDVRAALALVERGEAPLGIVYRTDARIAKAVRIVGVFPVGSHAPIVYPFAMIADSRHGDARAFLAFLGGPEGLAVFETYGFTANPAR